MSGHALRRRQRPWPFVFTVAGVMWAFALLPAALFVPFYSGEMQSAGGVVTRTTASLVGVNGVWVLLPVSLPLMLALLTWLGLHQRCSRGSNGGTFLAWGSVAALGLVSVVAAFSIGILVLPALLLLAAAAATTPIRASG
jgi:hypothetical protein